MTKDDENILIVTIDEALINYLFKVKEMLILVPYIYGP